MYYFQHLDLDSLDSNDGRQLAAMWHIFTAVKKCSLDLFKSTYGRTGKQHVGVMH